MDPARLPRRQGGSLNGGTPITEPRLTALRNEIDILNEKILALIQRRGDLVLQIAALKRSQGIDGYDAKREEDMLQSLTAATTGPFRPSEVREIFKAIFRASLDIQDREGRRTMHVYRKGLVADGGIRVGSVAIGGGEPVLFLGPCSVETEEQMDAIAAFVARLPGQKILRAGAFKPRT